VPGRKPEQTTRRLAPAHVAGGKPPAGRLTRKQAQDALADLLARERRSVGQGAYDHQPDGATFADDAAGFLHRLEDVKGREFSTLKDYRNSIRRYLNPRWGDRPVTAVRPADVEQLRDDLMQVGLSARTVVRHLTVAHGVFTTTMRYVQHRPGADDAARLSSAFRGDAVSRSCPEPAETSATQRNSATRKPPRRANHTASRTTAKPFTPVRFRAGLEQPVVERLACEPAALRRRTR